jgi:phosphoribosylglycinamide formyltransferase-1
LWEEINNKMKNIVLFASGNGSNAEKIIKFFKNSEYGKVVGVFSNKPDAKVLDRAKNHDIPSVVFNKAELNEGFVLEQLRQFQPDLIVLAGFLLKFPESILKEYPKVINIHPALLPKYGGKGMYGMNVHQAVLDNKEKETGITIHYVNEHYDEGEFIFQKSVNIEDCKTAEEIANKIHELEHQYFPKVISQVLNSKF